MDLAQIRKKARGRKRPEQNMAEPSAVSLESRAAGSIQGAPGQAEKPAPAVSVSPPNPASEASEAPRPAVDPLEALFSFRPDLDIATEEHYLESLMEGGQEALDGQLQWLTFSLGQEEYALDINDIREIIKPREITDIPRVPKFILGIISLRGVIIPVFDLRQRLKLGAVESTPASRIVVCEREDRSVGLLVDSITQVVRIAETSVEPPPSVLSGLDRDMVEGVGRHQGRMLILLDLNNVLNAELV